MTATSLDLKQSLAVLGVASTATGAMLAAQLIGGMTLAEIRSQCQASVYWPEFCAMAKADQVPEDWLEGGLGRVVLGWAREAA